eukprot:3397286-Prymnesium_polylepis.3
MDGWLPVASAAVSSCASRIYSLPCTAHSACRGRRAIRRHTLRTGCAASCGCRCSCRRTRGRRSAAGRGGTAPADRSASSTSSVSNKPDKFCEQKPQNAVHDCSKPASLR